MILPATPAQLSAIARALLDRQPAPPCPHEWETVWTFDAPEVWQRCKICGDEIDE